MSLNNIFPPTPNILGAVLNHLPPDEVQFVVVPWLDLSRKKIELKELNLSLLNNKICPYKCQEMVIVVSSAR